VINMIKECYHPYLHIRFRLIYQIKAVSLKFTANQLDT